jgi:hypothetical protein
MEAWQQAVEQIGQERERLQEMWLRKRLQLEADCRYGNEEYTPEQMQQAVRLMCKEDIFFFFNYFAWTVDPRQKAERQIMPFLLYEYQVDLVKWLLEHIGATQGTIERRNLILEKSRDMGASWVVALLAMWLCYFRNSNILIGSRKEEEVDKKGDLDCPFEKIRFNVRRLPPFLRAPGFDPDKHLGFLLLQNPEGGQIVGESANPEFGRGGRSLLTIFDEFSVWQNDDSAWKASAQTTNVRLAIATPKGPYGKFAKLASNDPEEQVIKKRLHWSMHPIKSAGIKHDHNGQLTSPWYEEQKRTMSPEDVASELDISYATSIKGLVFPDYTEQHATTKLEPVEKQPIIRVWDPGITFCVMFLQIDHYRRVLCLQEVIFENARIRDVAEEVLKISQEEYQGYHFIDCGDPAGARRVSASQEDPEYVILAEQFGIDVDYTFMSEMPTNLRVKNRIVAIHQKLREYVYQTKTPGLLVDSSRCPKLDEALRQNYRYRVNKFNKQVMEQIEEQHPFEDVVDCLGYGILYRLGLSTTSDSKKIQTVERGQVEWRGQIKRRV